MQEILIFVFSAFWTSTDAWRRGVGKKMLKEL
jgi:hypothetical protein